MSLSAISPTSIAQQRSYLVIILYYYSRTSATLAITNYYRSAATTDRARSTIRQKSMLVSFTAD